MLAEMGPGDLFGELSFIDDQPRSATVVTNVPSRLLVVHKEDFKKLMESNLTRTTMHETLTITNLFVCSFYSNS